MEITVWRKVGTAEWVPYYKDLYGNWVVKLMRGGDTPGHPLCSFCQTDLHEKTHILSKGTTWCIRHSPVQVEVIDRYE